MSPSVKNTYYRAKLLMKFPSAIPRLLLRGTGAATEHIDKMVASEYLRSPLPLVRRRGVWIYLRPDDGFVSPYIQVVGAYDIDAILLLERILRKEDTVLDIGANIGWHALICAKKAGKIYAFEPEPTNFSLLSKSVERNGFHNVKLFNCCVWNRDGDVNLMLSDENPGHNSIVWKVGAKSISVPCVTLNALALKEGLERIDLMVLDVEGAEPMVLSGASRLIDEGRITHIIMEYSPAVWVENPKLLSQIFRHYNVFEMRKDFKRLSLESLPPYHANLYLKMNSESER